MYKFIVITEVPDPRESSGNLAWMGEVFLCPQSQGKPYDAPPIPLPPHMAIWIRQPVFLLGEIVICNQDGREVAGAGRKPDKWYVETEEFDDLGAAIARAQEVLV